MTKKKNKFSIYWIYLILGLGLIVFQLYMGQDEKSSVKLQTLLNIADSSGVDNVIMVNEKSAEFHLNKKGLALVKKSKNKEKGICFNLATSYGRNSQKNSHGRSFLEMTKLNRDFESLDKTPITQTCKHKQAKQPTNQQTNTLTTKI